MEIAPRHHNYAVQIICYFVWLFVSYTYQVYKRVISQTWIVYRKKTALCNSSKYFSYDRRLVVKPQGSVLFDDFIKCTSVAGDACMSSKTQCLRVFCKNHRKMLMLD